MARKRQVTLYSPEQIERGLFALAICGNAAEAGRQLAATGQRVPQATLQTWKTKHAERYREITNQHVKQIREVFAQEQIEVFTADGDADEVPLLEDRAEGDAGLSRSPTPTTRMIESGATSTTSRRGFRWGRQISRPRLSRRSRSPRAPSARAGRGHADLAHGVHRRQLRLLGDGVGLSHLPECAA